MRFKNFIIAFGTPFLFAYLGLKLQKHIDKMLKSREPKDLRGGDGSKIDWVSLLEKHKDNLPLVAALFGALTGSSVVFF
jgi:hypothetical protein